MKTEIKEEERLLTAADLAALLSCSVSTVYALARRGLFPSVKIGGLIRFRRSAVDVVLNEPHSEDSNLGKITKKAKS